MGVSCLSFSSCAFREQEGHLATPSPSFCVKLNFLLGCGSKCLKSKGKAVSYHSLEKIEMFDTIFKGHTPCYMNYSCFGLLVALQWLRPAWCSVAYCVCGVPLKVVGAPDWHPTSRNFLTHLPTDRYSSPALPSD
jgi:hypothetical protein